MNNYLSDVKGYDAFIKQNSLALVSDEYPGYVGKIRYLLITDLQESLLNEEYPEMMMAISPYLTVGSYFDDIKREFDSNESKHLKRLERYSSDTEIENIGFDDFTEVFEHERDFCEELSFSQMIACLTKIEKSRITKRFVENKTFQEIADEDCVTICAVMKTVKNAMKKIRKDIGEKEYERKN